VPTPKPHRTIVSRMSGYAEEAAAYLRRRRLTRKPFARVYYLAGQSHDVDPETEPGRILFLAAANLIDASR
jgi:hypothetical protein